MDVLRGNSETELDAGAGRMASTAALEHARVCLETALAGSEDWRALKQLEAREANGEWFDVVESDVLRDRLTIKMAAAPEFIAWQFVDAAIGCLAAATQLDTAPALELAHEPPAVTTALVYDAEPSVASGVSAMPEPANLLPHALSLAPEPQTSSRELARRIPTLQAHERRAPLQRSAMPPAVDAAQRALERAMLSAAGATTDPAPQDDALPTRYAAAASSVHEADVQIIPRGERPALIETRLPPLPLTERAGKPGMRLPRVSRVAALKWAEPAEGADADYRPIGSALDEAQVSIIDTGEQSEAQARAERRALGVAPDREQHMRRFLRALVGE